jgi:predicted O-linked N-acetylglucosamine transferase (SPINDLY family)
MSASLLSAMGLEELITREISEYESLAVQIGCDHQKLKTLKEKLCQQVTAGNLFKTETAVRHLERAYGLMWDNFENGDKSSILKLQ